MTSPPAIVVPVRAARLLHPGGEGERVGLAEALGKPEHDVGLARIGAHRGEVAERARERAMADVGRGDRRVVEPEVDPVDHRVDADRLDRPRAHDRAVVARPANDPFGAIGQQPLEGGDEVQLGHRHEATGRATKEPLASSCD